MAGGYRLVAHLVNIRLGAHVVGLRANPVGLLAYLVGLPRPPIVLLGLPGLPVVV